MNDMELMQQALEALRDYRRSDEDRVSVAMGLLQEALAEQPTQQQEPVAYASDVEFDDETEIIPAEQKGKLGTAGLRIPLYIQPPASKPWVGLTYGEVLEQKKDDPIQFYRAIEAKLREKNA